MPDIRYPMLLQPACKDYLWGGERLYALYQKQGNVHPLAESWELSCHPDGLSTVQNGAFAGQTLAAVLRAHPALLGKGLDELPILVKLIDAAKPLSVQVHPDEEYAVAHEGQHGKTEMWVVLQAEPGATLVYGVSRPLTREALRTALQSGAVEGLLAHLPVRPGDVFFVPPGTLHAIGAGIVLAEIQQSSNVTYRVWDYGRVGADGKPRALHTEQALAVAALTPAAPPPVGEIKQAAGRTEQTLAGCPHFAVQRWQVAAQTTFAPPEDHFAALLCTEGQAALQAAGQQLRLQAGQTVFLPAALGECTLTGEAGLLYIR